MNTTNVIDKNQGIIYTKKEKIICALFFTIIAVLLLFYFIQTNPIIPFDTDDWVGLNSHRSFFPKWGGFNPIKVLPEVLQEIMGFVVSMIIYPIYGKFIESYAVGNGILMTTIIIVYLYLFYSLMRQKLSTYESLFITSLFLIFHFLIFRTSNDFNVNMFYESNLTCIYHYIIPDIINACLILYLLNNDLQATKLNIKFKTILYCAIYFAIFSNILSSVILASYIGMKLLVSLISDLYNKRFKITSYVKSHYKELIVIIIWLMSLLFERSGVRASQIIEEDYFSNLFECTKNVINIFASLNKVFICYVLFIILLSIYCFIRNNKSKKLLVLNNFTKKIICMVLNTLYLIVVCSASGSVYLTRPGVIFSIAFWLIMIVIDFTCYILKEIPQIKVFSILIVLFLAYSITTQGITFKRYNAENYSSSKVIKIDYEIINQIIKASEDNETEIELFVPKFDSDDNFPLALYGGQRIANTVYLGGLVDKRIIISKVTPIEDFESKYIY